MSLFLNIIKMIKLLLKVNIKMEEEMGEVKNIIVFVELIMEN